MTAQPSQVARPWHATVRTTLAAVVSVVAVVAPHASAVDWSDTSTYGLAVAVVALVTRILADPRVEEFLRHRAPWIAADPTPDQEHQ